MTPTRSPGRAVVILFVVVLALLAACTTTSGPDTAPAQPTYPAPAWGPAPEPSGPVLHVDPGGTDEGPGTAERPFRTIAAASRAAGPGTTVVVADGTYTGAFSTRASGTAEARLTYVAANKWGARLVGDGAVVDDDVDAVWRNYGDYVDVRGFDISGTTTDGYIETGSWSRILENHVHGFSEGTCVSTYRKEYTLHDIDIIGNVVHDCGNSALDHGIYPGHPRGTISNNISYGNAGFGIHCWHNCNELVITNNLVFRNGEGGILVGQGDGPNDGAVPADNMVVANNIAYDNSGFGIRESGATGGGNLYLNNTVAANGEDGLDLAAGSESGTLTVDPGFVDYEQDGSGDYRVLPVSPMVDAGTEAGAPPFDIDGVNRPQGGNVDIGVYER